MKKRITGYSAQAQTWITKIVKNTALFSATICLPCKTWERMLCHRPVCWDDCGEYCALLDAVEGLGVVRNSTKNLH